LDPGHVAPPFEGGGLLQSLLRAWVPPPQVLVQVDQLPQTPQFPS
jgi:hypothetical protein